MIRLQKYLAECGVASRRAAEKMIGEGRVSVNGTPAEIGCKIDPETDQIAVDQHPLHRDEKVYVVLNKPANVISTAKDTHGRKTVIECVEGVKARVYPVGRLDRDVEGVLLLTNDGELAHRLIHPSYEVDKTYLAWVQGEMTPETAMRLERGIPLEDGMTAPAKVTIQNSGVYTTQIRLILHEGRKREVKRMCAAVGHPVQILHRIAFADIKSKGLRPGEWRYLTHREIESLRQRVQLSHH